MKTKSLCKVLSVLVLFFLNNSCSDEYEEKDKTFTCSGNCRNFNIEVSGEGGEFQVNETCQNELEGGNLIKSTCSGTRKYLNSGNTYSYWYVINYLTCKYFVSVDGIGTCGDEDAGDSPPLLASIAISSITPTTAQSGGNISSDGGETISARGVCWSTEQTPTTADYKTTDGTGSGNFISLLTGLTSNTTYYVRAYAINRLGTGYGNIKSFTTLATVPVLSTIDVNAITKTSAQSGGTIISEGAASISVHGVCWSTEQMPTIADNKTTDGTGVESFISILTGLASNTTYYVRAYATNSKGTGYGNVISFLTLPALPILTTMAVSAITQTSMLCGGIITSDDGLSVTDRGVCWSTGKTPTITDNKTSDNGSDGSFISFVDDLNSSTAYYVRAYATNRDGTGYGSAILFCTLQSNDKTLADVDGNIYHVVTIGTQDWIVENLKTTKYNDNTAIPLVVNNAAWHNLTSPGYCWYNNDSVTYKSTYGALYNKLTVNTGKLCPTGWHVPDDVEWRELAIYVDGLIGKLKETGTSHWINPNSDATNESGFTALPSGNRYYDNGSFGNLRYKANYWSRTTSGGDDHGSFNLSNDYWTIWNYNWKYGFAVRCIKD